MITAAVVSSRWVPRIRPSGEASVSPASPRTCGITATPVSKPDMPSASLGKTSSATATIISGLPCCVVSAVVQSRDHVGLAYDVPDRDADDHHVERRYGATRATARPMASVNPRRNTAAQQREQDQGDHQLVAAEPRLDVGFSTRCAARRRPRGSW